MYLKWAFRDVCWQANESGACLIVDDPVLRTKYGFCDFHLLDAQMQQHTFTTNIAMIPWNARRTSGEMASLIKDSEGRLSVSVHGCDHTAGEFGIDKADELNAKVDSADRRMEQHHQTTGIIHDPIMVFPQGIFSRASLRTLQQHEFAAAVNTEALPLRRQEEILTIRDTWALAITRYGSFPLFTRRYPADGLENFAFDLLLGKPCLIVEHHVFFKGEHHAVVRFANALNALNTELHWRSLGDVIRRSYQWRLAPDGIVHVRMFANELLLQNGHGAERQYRVEKADAGSVGVKEVTANGRSLEWQTDGNFIVFSCKIPSGAEVLIRVRYTPLETTNGRRKGALSDFVQTAARRYLSEFRDNFLSRHDRLMAIAQKAKRMVSLRAFLNGEAIITMTAEAAAGLPASGGSRYDGESKQSRLSYALITPARNEALFIENTIRSVIAQTVRPRRWIIVSDGSTDGTDETVQRYVSQHGWIELLRMPERRDRQFAAKAHAFNAGYALLKDLEFDIIGNLDADITFDRDYLSFLLSKFQLSPELGVAGTPFVEDHDRLNHHSYAHQFAQLEHVSGACQMFRKECFEEVGGYVPVKAGAVDWIAVTAARMKGWRTRTFTEKVCFHHRKLGVGSGSHGKLRMRFHYGRKAYYVGGHPLWECLHGLFQVHEKPFVLGGVWFIAGYVWAALHRSERTVSHELMHFHRAEQMARLRQIFSRLAGNRGRI
jgi:glycosyltransferase involved in cell wall biosynthesis